MKTSVHAIEWIRVDPQEGLRHVPAGWVAYSSSKSVQEMLASAIDDIARLEGLSRENAYKVLAKRCAAMLGLKVREGVVNFCRTT